MIDHTRLAHDEEFFQLVLDEASNVIFVKDSEFRIIYANKAFLMLYPEEQRNSIIGTTTLESFRPEEAEGFLAEDRKALAGQRTQILEDITDHEGVTRSLLTRKIGFKSNDGEAMMLGISSDVTELVKKEQALVEVNRSLEHFAAVAAHDLRTPLHHFHACLELMKMDPKNQISEQSLQYMEMMQTSAYNLAEQISSLLMVYKNKHQDSWEKTDLNMLLAEVRFNLNYEIEISHAKLLNDMLPALHVNPHLFRQLLQNLIENSIKYKSEKDPLIMVKADSVEGGYEFSVEDNGLGIRAGSDAFKLFEQENTKSSGAGIGLALCRRIVEQHKGRIWIDEACTSGTCIRFYIPAQA